jgi:hypothetical protein
VSKLRRSVDFERILRLGEEIEVLLSGVVDLDAVGRMYRTSGEFSGTGSAELGCDATGVCCSVFRIGSVFSGDIRRRSAAVIE